MIYNFTYFYMHINMSMCIYTYIDVYIHEYAFIHIFMHLSICIYLLRKRDWDKENSLEQVLKTIFSQLLKIITGSISALDKLKCKDCPTGWKTRPSICCPQDFHYKDI